MRFSLLSEVLHSGLHTFIGSNGVSFSADDPSVLMSDRRRVHVHVSGTVQGVYFRATTREEAQKRDIDGWVRNLPDGRVEAIFEGPPGDVTEMVEFCHDGSPGARVETVEVTDEDPQGEAGFEVRW